MKEFKLFTTSILEFKKIESDDETKYSTFFSSKIFSPTEIINNDSSMADVLSQSIVGLYETCQNCLEMVRVGLLTQL